jgi:hypothetical protein
MTTGDITELKIYCSRHFIQDRDISVWWCKVDGSLQITACKGVEVDDMYHARHTIAAPIIKGVARKNFGGVLWDRGARGAKRPRARPKDVLGGCREGFALSRNGSPGYNPRKLF